MTNNKKFSTGMKILAIETSCDETAIALIEAKKEGKKTKFKILGNEVSSQIAIHAQYGGVFPMMAKREHGKNILSILEKVLKEAKLNKLRINNYELGIKDKEKILKSLERENDLGKNFVEFITKIEKPKVDAIVVTTGPGLEPALWVGISFAKTLGEFWNIPVIGVNHMEGHMLSIFPQKSKTFVVDLDKNSFPMLSLLVSGGHTELVLVKNGLKKGQLYKKIGSTRDDAAGEAFDKVARMLELSYPGGPEISRLADQARKLKINNEELVIKLPRPMIYSKDYDFSFSGLKTAVLYLIRDLKKQDSNILQNDKIKQKIAKEFENAVIETLVYKTIKAINEYKIKTLIVGGGVSANSYLQKVMTEGIKNNNKTSKKLKTKVYFPSKSLTGDNALMIAIAGYFEIKNKNSRLPLKANGNLSL